MLNALAVPVLLVDDRPENLAALTALLDVVDGLELVCAASGEEALRQLLKRDFALVLLDAQMPGMDGFETATLMRANPKTRGVPIVFVTADLGDDDVQCRGYESGAVDFLLKPIDARALYAKVGVYVTLHRQRLAIAGYERDLAQMEAMTAEYCGQRRHQGDQIRLLLVDDHRENLVALGALLAELEYVELVEANSGPEALQAVLRQDFAAILLDVQMPGMDGFETAQLIREHPRAYAVPILFVTAGMKERAALFKGYEKGAVDYLIKPLEPAILLSKVRVFCDLYRQRIALEKQGAYLESLAAERSAALKRSTEELAESRERYRRLLGAVTHQLFSVMRQGRQLRSYGHSQGCEAVTGYPLSAFETDPALWLAIVVEDDRTAIQSAVAHVLDTGATWQLEHQLRRCDGRLIWVRSTFVSSGTREQPACDVLSEDIEQRRRAEQDQARLADKLALATRAARLGIWDWDLENDVLVWDERMYELCGVRPGQLGDAHHTWLATVHPDDQALCQLAMDRALRNEAAFDIEFRVRRPDGAIRFMKADGQIVRDAQGRPLRMTGIHYDITERKLAEEDLRRHRDHLQELVDERSAYLRAVVDNAADGILTFDADGHVLSFNAAAERMFGQTADQVIGRHIDLLIPSELRDTYLGYLARANANADADAPPNQRSGRELQGQRGDGSRFPLYLATSRIELGGRRHFTGIVRDITEQKAAEAGLIEARRAAETANQVKSEFLANMSHELRTPLNAVIGFSQLMAKSSSLSAEQRHNLGIINRSGHHLLTLINDVLELSKIEAGRMSVAEVDIGLEGLLREVVEMLRMRAEQAGLTLVLEMDGVPARVRVDAVKLRQVLINLVGNAIKFTRQGGVQLTVRGTSGAGRAARVDFAIADSGIGLEAHELERIFEPFVQMTTHVAAVGTGLGLTISRQYVQLLGGALSVSSAPGKGSVFRFSLPLDALDTEIAPVLPLAPVLALPDEARGKRVLLVEDNAESREMLRQMLEPLGFVVDEARDGIDALALLERSAPDLIVMDWRMPRLDGLETTRRVRKLPLCARVPIVMFTASAFEEQRAEALAAGATAFMRKPLDEADMYEVFEAELGLRFVRQQVQAASAPAADTPLRREDLAALPQPLREALRMAVGQLDIGNLNQLVEQVAATDPELAAGLTRMAVQFQFPQLWQLLQDEA